MSRYLNAKKSTAGQFSGELRNRKYSAPVWLPDKIDKVDESSIYSDVEIDKSSVDESSSLRELPTSAVKSLLNVKKIGPWQPLSDWIHIILLVIAISINPLFFYIPVISEDINCLELDLNLFRTAFSLCSVCDLFHVLYTLPSLLLNRFDTSGDFLLYILIDYVVMIPLQTVVAPDLILKMRGPEFSNAMTLLKLVFLIIYVTKIIRIYSLFTKATGNSGKFAEATWARAAFNLFLYLQAANVFGALWYLMAIERKTECWKKACRNHIGHTNCSFNCADSLGDYTFLNEFCPTKTWNTAVHDFGIFHDALKSGIVELTNFPQKFLHCFLWGLKNLSSIGRNLETSSDVGENFFVISIVISSLVLFGLLIGDMQKYLLSRNVRLKEMTQNAQELEEWEPLHKLSKNLRQEVKKHRQYIQRKTNDINVENVLNNLPMELRKEVKRELCLKLLKKVQEFRMLKKTTLDALCECVKPSFFIENSHIVREGDPIDEMIFVVQGKLWTYCFKDRTSGFTSKREHMAEGEFYGEELLHWALKNDDLLRIDWRKFHSHDIPKSTRTIEALTNVEAFTLMADDLINVLIIHQFSAYFELNSYSFKDDAARVIQLAWRRHHSKRPS